jgi:tyrosinase
LDWEDLSHSSIWNVIDGFGGDGDINGNITVAQGRCITEGPFAGTQLQYFDRETHPHCLSRGFINFDTKELGSLSGYYFRPEAMGTLSRAPDYDTFRAAVETTSHNAMHWGIRGDFGQYSAANG